MPQKKRKQMAQKMRDEKARKRACEVESSDEEVGSDGDKYSYARGTLEDEDEDHVQARPMMP